MLRNQYQNICVSNTLKTINAIQYDQPAVFASLQVQQLEMAALVQDY